MSIMREADYNNVC